MFHNRFHETSRRRRAAAPEPIMDIAKEDILFLSPSKPIIKTIHEVFAQTGQHFLVHEAVMEEAVRLASAYIEKNGTKVVVSNGGTASLLKRRVQAHVLEIRYTNFDLVHAITTALEYSPSVAIVGFESFIYNAVQVRDFFKSPLLIETVDSLDEIRSRAARQKRGGRFCRRLTRGQCRTGGRSSWRAHRHGKTRHLRRHRGKHPHRPAP